VRYVGEAIAACVAPTRAEAEDLAATVRVDYRPLHAVMDALTECTSSPALVHEYFGDNRFQEGRLPAETSRPRHTVPA
jgi:carbon-monoxide dehydrogenase large subunit